jgi:uncharacterized membrane protein
MPLARNGAPAVNTVSVWRFDTSGGAEEALHVLERLQTRRLVVIDDAALLVWRSGAPRPSGYQVGTATGTTALSGAFWGLLFGLLFLIPLAGATEDSAVLAGIGLTDEFLADVRSRITAGTSALFLLTDAAAVDGLHEALDGSRTDLLVSTLDHEQQAALQRAFDADETDDTDLLAR